MSKAILLTSAVTLATFALSSPQDICAGDSFPKSKPKSAQHKMPTDKETSAEKFYKNREYGEAISLLEPSYPFENSPDQLECLRMLGQSYYSQKNFDLALRTFQHWLDVEQRVHPINQPYIGQERTILGDLYAQHGQMTKAEKLYLPIAEKMDATSRQYLATQMKLSLLYEISNEYDKAESVLKSLLRVSEQQRGDLTPETADVRYSLARIYVKENREKEAEALYKELLRKYESVASPSDDLANSLSHMAFFYYKLGKNLSEAEKQLIRSLSIRRSINDQALIAKSLEDLQLFYAHTGQQAKILALFPETSGIENVEESPSVWKKRAAIFARTGNLEASERELSKLLSQLELDKNANKLEVTNVMYVLGQLYVLDHKLLAAEPLLEQAHKGFPLSEVKTGVVMGSALEDARNFNNDIFGVDRWHYDRYPRSCHFLGALYAQEQKFSEAESVYRNELKSQSRSSPDFRTIQYYNALAWILLQEGKFDESIQALKDAMFIADKNTSLEKPAHESVLLNGNEALVLEKAGKDPVPLLLLTLHAIRTNLLYESDPVPDFGIETYEYSDEYYCSTFWSPGRYNNPEGKSRVEPTFGYSSPPLVLFANGSLGTGDFSLFPGESSRADYFERDKNPQLEFLDWMFAFWNRGEERLEALVQVRLGDVYINTGRMDEAAKEYDQSVKVAQRDDTNKEVLAVAYEHKAKLLRKVGELVEANRCEDHARTCREEVKQRYSLEAEQ